MPCSISAQSAESVSPALLLKSIQDTPETEIPSFFKAVTGGSVSPDYLQRYGAEGSYFFSLHALEMGHPEAAEELLRHAAEAEGSPVREKARQEYLDLLLEKGEYEELLDQSRHYIAQGDAQPGYLIALGRALYREGRLRELDELLEEYGEIFERPEAHGFREEYSILKIYALMGRAGDHDQNGPDRQGWDDLLLELISRTESDGLPEEFFTASGGFWENIEKSPVLGQGERNLILGKRAYFLRRSSAAYEYYAAFLEESLQRPELLAFCTEVVTDEYVLSALYSGNAVEAVREMGVLLEVVVSGEGGSREHRERARFWLLESLGYLQRRLGRFAAAQEAYTEALELGPSAEEKRIRWYIFDIQVRRDPLQAVKVLSSHIPHWDDHAYFSDVLFDLIDRLVRYGRWDLVAEMADILSTDMQSTATARACFIAARAAMLGFIPAEEKRIDEWLRRAVENGRGAGAGLYYRFIAAAFLEQRGAAVVSTVLDPAGFCRGVSGIEGSNGATRSWVRGEGVLTRERGDETVLLRGFLRFGLAEEAYRRYGTDDDFLVLLPLDAIREWADSLRDEEAVIDSIRLFTAYCNLTAPELTYEDVLRLYPREYSEMIDSLSQEYELPAYLFYALVREESHFDADIQSAAGAVGLGQLMPATARDVASRTGIEASDLTDPAVNLRLSAWYLDHLIGRTDTYSQALFSYNGGITRVRRWVQDNPALPGDLLLEKIPYAETSHYGRKVLVSSILYGWFHYGYEYRGIVETFFNEKSE